MHHSFCGAVGLWHWLVYVAQGVEALSAFIYIAIVQQSVFCESE